MTLTWADIDARWPDAGVMWDRDVAPTIDWDPRLEVHDDTLWALSGTCMSNEPIRSGDGPGAVMYIWMQGQGETHRHNCRCMAWCDGAWVTQAVAARKENAHAWHREFLSRWREVYPIGLPVVVMAGQSNGHANPGFVCDFGPRPRQHLRGSRAQRKRKRAALRGL